MMTRVASPAYATPLLLEEYSRRQSYIMLRHAFDTFDYVSYLGGEFVQNWIKQGSFAWRQLVEQIERNLWELGDNVHFLKSGRRHSFQLSSFKFSVETFGSLCPSLVTHNMRTSVNTRGFCFLSTRILFSLRKIGGSTGFNWHWTKLGHWSFCAKGGRSVARSTRKLAESHL